MLITLQGRKCVLCFATEECVLRVRMLLLVGDGRQHTSLALDPHVRPAHAPFRKDSSVPPSSPKASTETRRRVSYSVYNSGNPDHGASVGSQSDAMSATRTTTSSSRCSHQSPDTHQDHQASACLHQRSRNRQQLHSRRSFVV